MLIVDTNFFEYEFEKDKTNLLVFDDCKLKSFNKVFGFKIIKYKEDLKNLDQKNLISSSFFRFLLSEKNLPFDFLIFDLLLNSQIVEQELKIIKDLRNPPGIHIYTHTSLINPLSLEYKKIEKKKDKKIEYIYNSKIEKDFTPFQNNIIILIVDDYDYFSDFKKDDLKIFFFNNLPKNYRIKNKTSLLIAKPCDLIPLPDEIINKIYVMNKVLYKEYFKFLENYLIEGKIFLEISKEEYENLPILNLNPVQKNIEIEKFLKEDLDLFPFIVLISILEVVKEGNLIYYLESFNNFYKIYKTIFVKLDLIDEFKIILDKIVENYHKYKNYDLEEGEINIEKLLDTSKSYLEKNYKVYHLKDKINIIYTDNEILEKFEKSSQEGYPEKLIKSKKDKDIKFYLT
jgi:hypothetical protein